MKTTIDIPDELFLAAKATAASRGITLRQVVTDTLREALPLKVLKKRSTQPLWMQDFGKLSNLSAETKRIQSLIDEEFEQVESER